MHEARGSLPVIDEREKLSRKTHVAQKGMVQKNRCLRVASEQKFSSPWDRVMGKTGGHEEKSTIENEEISQERKGGRTWRVTRGGLICPSASPTEQ